MAPILVLLSIGLENQIGLLFRIACVFIGLTIGGIAFVRETREITSS